MRKNGVENSEHLDLISKDNSYVNLLSYRPMNFRRNSFLTLALRLMHTWSL